MKVIMSYSEPDLDGIACMYAYSELLNRQNENVGYYIWNKPKQEVEIVCDMFEIILNGLKLNEIPKDSEYIIVDLNGKDQMHDMVETEKICEIIDHHGISRFLPNYNNAQRIQIDRLGAAATIVTERYKASGLIPSREAAILLYYGIISNSMNLKSSNTRIRDVNACNWLESICSEISKDKIREIFIKKSKIDDKNLRVQMECERANVFQDFSTIVAQLEIANLEDFLKDKKQKIMKIMREVKEEKNVDYVFIICIDILNECTIIFGVDENTKHFIENTFEYKFNVDNVIKMDKIVERKEITKLLREKFNKKVI